MTPQAYRLDCRKRESRLMKTFNIWNISIKKQLFCMFFLICGIPILALSTFMYFESSRFNTENMQSMLENLVTRYEESTSRAFEKLEDQMNVIALSGTMRQSIRNSREGLQPSRDLQDSLNVIFNSVIYSDEEIDVALYIDNCDEILAFGRVLDIHNVKHRFLQRFEEDTEELLSSALFEQARDQRGRPVWALMEADGVHQILAVKSLISLGYAEPQGYLVFFMKTDAIIPFTPEDMPRDDAALVILNDAGNVMMNVKGPASSLEITLGEQLDQSEVKSCIVSQRKMSNGWTLQCLMPQESFLADMKLIGVLAILIGIGLIACAFFVLQAYAVTLNERLDSLLGKMRKAQSGDLRVTEFLKGQDELKNLDDGFNHMMEKLSEYISETYIQQLEKREAQLRMLRFQINPHFLYNTLASMHAMSMMEGNERLSEMIQHLAAMFRYSIGESPRDLVTVEEELSHVKDYVYLQKIRFEDRLTVSYDVDQDLLQCPMLRFILQPIVENSVKHGLNEGEGRIWIEAYPDQEGFIFSVRDNGSGISPDQLAIIRQELDSDQVEACKIGIGLYNVHSRLRLRYGEGYGIRISSNTEGTVVHIRLPRQGAEGK